MPFKKGHKAFTRAKSAESLTIPPSITQLMGAEPPELPAEVLAETLPEVEQLPVTLKEFAELPTLKHETEHLQVETSKVELPVSKWEYDISQFPMVAISRAIGTPFNSAMDSESSEQFQAYVSVGWEPYLVTSNNRDHTLIVFWRRSR